MTAPSQPDSTPDDAAGIVGITRLFFRCGYCDKTVELRDPDQKFCSRSCSARYRGMPDGFRMKHIKKPRPILTCKCCGKSFSQRKASPVNSYCSKECIRIGRPAAARLFITTESHSKQKLSLKNTIDRDPRLRKGPENQNAKVWRLRSPRGITYEFKNLSHFIRQNPDLFAEADVEWKPGYKGRGQTCRALGGIKGLSPHHKTPSGGWKGWTWWSITERLHGGDLLNRKNS